MGVFSVKRYHLRLAEKQCREKSEKETAGRDSRSKADAQHLASETTHDERPMMNQKAAGFSGGLPVLQQSMELSQFLDLIQRVMGDPGNGFHGDLFLQHGNNVGFPFFLTAF